MLLAQWLSHLGRFDEAARAAELSAETGPLMAELVKAVASPPGSPAHSRGLEIAREIGVLPMASGGGTNQPGWLVLLGEPDAALDQLEELFSGSVIGIEMIWLPQYDPIRNDPRFQAIVDGLELPER